MSKQSSAAKTLLPFCEVWYNTPKQMCVKKALKHHFFLRSCDSAP